VKKENSERHSQRCDVELKLAVRKFMNILALLCISAVEFSLKYDVMMLFIPI
jgi:hypothetical protein